ncbi:MAG: SET domain-containing protein [Ignavibacterium sp.]|nr:SET domain-containing protein [Ignavibacterium sp.]MCX7612471.1 SET domain-containing protein [Ignavibacterium sp.]MDW8374851.1 SET domain-containing protein [Ignavibacteriales bacterium]
MQFNEELIVVKESTLHGKGIFTSVPINKGTIIMKIIGEIIDEEECIRRENEENNVYIFYKDDNVYIDAKNSEKIKYLNHSCDCNCYVDEDENGDLILVALRDIQKDEELTIDYGYEEIYNDCSCNECDNKSN